ncbi:YajQ family cyclic di-GMP-binding protein [Candidatus Peregrinibacteria bacterium CG_4_9_14_0_2_um_filter_38_9]|nr:MAG: YajQ family cyclic di-GMP-binding protein [Candidatus Peregrinibacteria bacterium CG_4_9_14_0_2_um_filter_38_9]
MASDHSMDIAAKFDMQEMRNAVDQAKKEILTRYDLKDSHIEIELTDDLIKVNTANEFQLDTVYEIIMKRMAARGLSTKILDRQTFEPAGGMRMKQEIKLVKSIDQESAKTITKLIRDNFQKTKTNIQGDEVRVTSKSIDDLQGIMKYLQSKEDIKVPLFFTNFR